MVMVGLDTIDTGNALDVCTTGILGLGMRQPNHPSQTDSLS